MGIMTMVAFALIVVLQKSFEMSEVIMEGLNPERSIPGIDMPGMPKLGFVNKSRDSFKEALSMGPISIGLES